MQYRFFLFPIVAIMSLLCACGNSVINEEPVDSPEEERFPGYSHFEKTPVRATLAEMQAAGVLTVAKGSEGADKEILDHENLEIKLKTGETRKINFQSPASVIGFVRGTQEKVYSLDPPYEVSRTIWCFYKTDITFRGLHVVQDTPYSMQISIDEADYNKYGDYKVGLIVGRQGCWRMAGMPDINDADDYKPDVYSVTERMQVIFDRSN